VLINPEIPALGGLERLFSSFSRFNPGDKLRGDKFAAETCYLGDTNRLPGFGSKHKKTVK
jgi:hypothetical protein